MKIMIYDIRTILDSTNTFFTSQNNNGLQYVNVLLDQHIIVLFDLNIIRCPSTNQDMSV